ncbi:MAG: DUF3489 domain-containing protein [Alphaproteobacteria bacterium]|nr:DUF3489 domain-containing protein [Alphaproteobacteria bacterium]
MTVEVGQALGVGLVGQAQPSRLDRFLQHRVLGWAAHTCRGVLAGALKKRLGLAVTSTKEAGGERVYKPPV